MDLTNEFRVAVPISTAWEVLTDVERIAPCLPGAQLQEIEGDEYRGIVKVKVGPITAQYKGAATFLEQEQSAGKLVLHAEGRDTRGQGTAAADITAQLTEDGAATKVVVTTDLKITGKVAQFGRGVLVDVSSKLLDQFVECLESKVLAEVAEQAAKAAEVAQAAEAAEVEQAEEAAEVEQVEQAVEAEAPDPATAEPVTERVEQPTEAKPAVRKVSMPEPQPVDLLDSAGAPMLKRFGPIITAIVVVLFLGRRWRRRR